MSQRTPDQKARGLLNGMHGAWPRQTKAGSGVSDEVTVGEAIAWALLALHDDLKQLLGGQTQLTREEVLRRFAPPSPYEGRADEEDHSDGYGPSYG
jgi:hypothetical protein